MKITIKNDPKTARILLQTGLAAVFLYAGFSSLKTPADWVGYFPSFIATASSAMTLVKLFGFAELLLALWLLSSRYLRLAALLTALLLAGIVLVNPHQLIITFRDIGLLFTAVALLFLAD